MFINVSKNFRRKNLNFSLDKRFINRLAHSTKMAQFISVVTQDKELNKLRKSLFKLKAKNLDFKSNFAMALFALENKKEKKAFKYLKYAYKKALKRKDKDKILFWLYQVTKRKKYLKALLFSKNINIYTLYARDILGKQTLNFFTYTKTTMDYSYLNLEDPFVWYKISKNLKKTPKDKLFKLYIKYQQKNMVPIQTLILEKAYNYDFHGYVMPYNRYLLDATKDEKALVYAIMKQESGFIPSAISISYALGLMQLMPFLVDEIANNLGEKVEYKDMFKAKNNIRYARKHIKWLKKQLNHPLFIAYAYNGGIGFLKKHLKNSFKSGKYEPFLSMELMRNSQSREYGKKVLANYVIYKEILNDKVSIVELFNKLKK